MTPRDALADALADLGLVTGATIASVQERARVDIPTAMRLLAVHAAFRALAAAQETPIDSLEYLAGYEKGYANGTADAAQETPQEPEVVVATQPSLLAQRFKDPAFLADYYQGLADEFRRLAHETPAPQVESRSVQRRKAIMRGEPRPTFDETPAPQPADWHTAYPCAVCGAIGYTPILDSVDSGTTLTCSECGGKTVVELRASPAERPIAPHATKRASIHDTHCIHGTALEVDCQGCADMAATEPGAPTR